MRKGDRNQSGRWRQDPENRQLWFLILARNVRNILARVTDSCLVFSSSKASRQTCQKCSLLRPWSVLVSTTQLQEWKDACLPAGWATWTDLIISLGLNPAFDISLRKIPQINVLMVPTSGTLLCCTGALLAFSQVPTNEPIINSIIKTHPFWNSLFKAVWQGPWSR